MELEVDINEALIHAAKDGNTDDLRRLVELGADVNYNDIPPFFGRISEVTRVYASGC